jgi:hypothetical protein
MLKFLSPRRDLVEETSLSHFVHKATAAQKRKIYNRVIQQAAEEQRLLIEGARVQHKQQERAPA